MSTAVAKRPKNAGDAEDEGKRKPGRPATNIETEPFCCRAAIKLVAAFTHLAKVRRTKRAGTELHTAAEDHIRRMYLTVKAEPDSAFLDRDHVEAFLKAAEAYFRETGQPIPEARD